MMGAVDVAIDKVHQHFGAGRAVNTAPQLGPATPGLRAPRCRCWRHRGMAGGLGANGVGAAQSAVDGGAGLAARELDARDHRGRW